MLKAFHVLAKLKGLRGGPFDIFGKTAERCHERQMIEDYVQLMDEVASQLNAGNHAQAIRLASVPDAIRGYGHVKEKSIAQAAVLQAERLAAFRNPKVEVRSDAVAMAG